MGQAKARGTFEQRKAEAIERERILAEKRSEQHRALMKRQAEERAERIRNAPPEERKVLLVDSGRAMSSMGLMAALLASNMGAMSVPLIPMEKATRRRYRK